MSTWLFFSFLFFTPPFKGDMPKTIYDFKVEGLEGGVIDFSQFKGKKILIVNTASECGYTPQYEDLQKLYERYKDKLVVIGFPANDFLRQEPGSNEDIASFCKRNYGVTFPMAGKITVKGENMALIYRWLTEEKYNGYKNSKVKWNFQKYLVDEKGQLVGIFAPSMEPLSDEIIAAIMQ